MRFMRGSKHVTQNTPKHWIAWFGCTAGNALLAYIIASAIPDFSNLVSLVGAFGGTLMSMQPMGYMWLSDNWQKERSLSWMFLVGWASFVILAGSFLTVAGSYGALVGIIDDYSASTPWSCADNSG